MTMKPIADRAEVALEFPEKTYMGSFTHASKFEAKVEPDGVMLKLARGMGTESRAIEFHLHWLLFADVLRDLAQGLAGSPVLDDPHRVALAEAAEELAGALKHWNVSQL